MVPETSSNPFTASEEAFFQAAAEEHAPSSEEPVTFDAPFVEASSARVSVWSVEREARRARYARFVTSTVAVLCALTLVGLARLALRSDPLESSTKSAARAHALVSTRATASPPLAPAAGVPKDAPASTATRDLAAGVAFEPPSASVSLFMSRCDGTAPSDSTVQASPPDESAPSATDTDQPPDRAPAEVPGNVPESDKPAARGQPPAHHGPLARIPARSAPVTQAGLLSAIRSLRPAHSDARKTL